MPQRFARIPETALAALLTSSRPILLRVYCALRLSSDYRTEVSAQTVNDVARQIGSRRDDVGAAELELERLGLLRRVWVGRTREVHFKASPSATICPPQGDPSKGASPLQGDPSKGACDDPSKGAYQPSKGTPPRGHYSDLARSDLAQITPPRPRAHTRARESEPTPTQPTRYTPTSEQLAKLRAAMDRLHGRSAGSELGGPSQADAVDGAAAGEGEQPHE